MVDALSLWAANRQSICATRLSVIKEILDDVHQLDGSLDYLMTVHKGGLVRNFLFRVELIDFGSLRTGGFASLIRAPSFNVASKIQQLRERRELMVRRLGGLLLGQEVVKDESDPNRSHDLIIKPTWISKYLIPSVGYGLFSVVTLRFICQLEWSSVVRVATDLCAATRHLIGDWIVTPLMDIWRTIRYRSSNLALVSQTALQADIASLERMVVKFARHTYPNMSPEQVAQQVRQGDVTLLLKRYEEELMAPVRNILAGDLVTMLLIQVQKSKVDLESAMMAMDRLLRANELNFELLAVVPLLFILYCTIGAGRYYVGRWMNRTDDDRLLRIRSGIYQLETLFNSEKPQEEIIGDAFLVIQDILNHWSALSNNRLHSRFGQVFLSDLSSLLANVGNQSRLWTIVKMFHHYTFLARTD